MIKYFALCLLIWLKATKIIKIFISVIPFYGNKDICLGFVWLVLCALLLLKIIFSMEGLCRCFGVCRKMCGVCVCTFLKWLKCEKNVREKLSWFSLLHTTRRFSLKSRPIHFHINRNVVIRSVKRNQLSFPSIEINKLLLTPVHSVLQIRFKRLSIQNHLKSSVTEKKKIRPNIWPEIP